jgi:hypothetical protein
VVELTVWGPVAFKLPSGACVVVGAPVVSQRKMSPAIV